MSKQETYIDTSLTNGNGKRFVNLFPANKIGDYNGEGFDSVESEDFEPGAGCVPLPVPRKANVLPPVIDSRTPEQIAFDTDSRNYFFMTDAEKAAIDDKHLLTHNIKF